jgi:hypothetical protein
MDCKLPINHVNRVLPWRGRRFRLLIVGLSAATGRRNRLPHPDMHC